MKKPVVNYREFRLSRIHEPQYAHIKLLAGWIGYFILYFLTENLIPLEKCHLIHCWLDDVIPFNEYFFIPYTFWFLLVAGSLLWFFLYDIPNFKNLSKFIIVTQVVAMAVYIIYPSRQDLRPDVFPRDNFLTHVAAFIYAFDTPTGVCPSLHVAYSVGIASTWAKKKDAPVAWRAFVILAAAVISIATAFVKQHSVVDILCAIPVCILAEWIVFRGYWRERLGRKTA